MDKSQKGGSKDPVRLAKLEPHVSEPVMDGRDVDSFVDEIHNKNNNIVTEASTNTPMPKPPVQREQEEVKNGFIRLADFIAKQKVKTYDQKIHKRVIGHQTTIYIASSAYKKQRSNIEPKETKAVQLKIEI